MKITVHGSGYVGLVSAACFAHMGNEVLCVDINAQRVARLRQGDIPIHEPGLAPLVREGLRSGTLRFTTRPADGVRHGLLQFIAVGTPPNEDGSADVCYVLDVARGIARLMNGERIIVTKSTVPVGTADRVSALIEAELAQRGTRHPFDVVSNPEFLKEGAAVKDFLSPDRVIIGATRSRSIAVLKDLYASFCRKNDRLMVMAVRDAEFTKYAANAALAARISLMNEFAGIAERLNVDIEAVRRGIGADPRIGDRFLYPGCGYGGSCFPKDIKALIHSAERNGCMPRILHAVESVNRRQKALLFEKLYRHFNGRIAGRTFAIWGLAFKPNTDDMREAPSRALIERLWEHGAKVRAHDPAAMQEALRIYGERSDLRLCNDPYAAAEGADALLLVTEWPQYRNPDFALLRNLLRLPLIFDGRNLFDPAALADHGFTYYGIGRPATTPQYQTAVA